MKGKYNGGFSLVECLVAIAILALVTIPTCTGLIMSVRMNGKTDELMQAQLAVSSAVETLMAEGITEENDKYDIEITADNTEIDHFPSVSIKTEQENTGDPYYKVTVTSTVEGATDVSVTTYIRAVEAAAEEVGGE